jgi:hypothetical protein
MSDDTESNSSGNLGRSGWVIICPEEDSQLGDVFFSSDEASKLCVAHNKSTGHNATIQPITNA